MKTQFFRFLVLTFAFLIFSVAAFAQSNPMSVEIPFNFHVGNEKLAAGKYNIRRISANSFLLRSEDGEGKVLVQTPLTLEVEKSAASEKLVFNRYGNKYFLRQIFANRANVGRSLYESKTEKMTRRGLDTEMEAKTGKPEKVEVVIKSK